MKIHKVEMRNHILTRSKNKKEDRNSRENASDKQREEEGEEGETTDEAPTPPRRTRRPNLTLIPRRIMNHPVVLFGWNGNIMKYLNF